MRATKAAAGDRFGRLVVLEQSGRQSGTAMWLCQCDCGNKHIVRSDHLISGRTKSCGCKRRKWGDNREAAAFSHLITRYRSAAKKRGLVWGLSDGEFGRLTKERCHYCGCEPGAVNRLHKAEGSYTYNGIDRVNSDIGYLSDNVVACCYRCNIMKSNMPYQDFIEHCRRIVDYSTARR